MKTRIDKGWPRADKIEEKKVGKDRIDYGKGVANCFWYRWVYCVCALGKQRFAEVNFLTKSADSLAVRRRTYFVIRGIIGVLAGKYS
jgi:hypothetical protein